MTRAQLAQVENLFRAREEIQLQIKGLQESKGDVFEAGARLTGGRQDWVKFRVDRAFIGAQLTAQIIDIERRICAAGGTL